LFFATSLFVSAQFYGQDILSQNDTITKLSPVLVNPKKQSPERLPEIKTTLFFVKNEVVRLSSINGNFATNNAREIFSRIPGVNIWENEGSGIQINVGVRGLSPNRSWELNTRQTATTFLQTFLISRSVLQPTNGGG
jgi:Fe(3+) dicitrate transport protein